LNIGDGVYIFVLAVLAPSYECAGRIRLLGFEFILEACHLSGNGDWERRRCKRFPFTIPVKVYGRPPPETVPSAM
jgi:hypothetical protein